MNPYPSYKDSGVEWIGEIPSHWDRSKIKFLSKIISKGTTPSTIGRDILEQGPIFYIKIDNFKGEVVCNPNNYIDEETHELLRRSSLEGDDILVVITGSTTGKTVILSKEFIPSNTNQNISFVRLKDKRKVRFTWYWLSSENIQNRVKVMFNISTLPSLSMEDLGNFHIPQPSIEEQTHIVDYLDEQTQKIDELIEKTEQKIELLKEKRTSLINHCVTKGLNPNVEMKDSGVEWIGEIPSGWSIQPIKYLKKDEKDSIIDGPFGSSVDVNKDYGDYEIPVIRTLNITDNGFSSTNLRFMRREKYEELKRHNVLPNDILFSKVGTIGNVCLFPSDYTEGVLSTTGSCRIRVDEKKVDKEFLVYLLISSKEHFQLLSGQNVQPFLNMITIKDVRIPIPTLPEQQQIIEYLNEQTQKIDTTIEKETQRIELLKEYRQSLISEVVMGKIDVRDEVVT